MGSNHQKISIFASEPYTINTLLDMFTTNLNTILEINWITPTKKLGW